MRSSVRAVVFAALFVVAASAIEVQAKHARVELISQQTALRPGQEDLLGIHFSLEKDWHISHAAA